MASAVFRPTLATRGAARVQGRCTTRAASQQPKALVSKVNRTIKGVEVNSRRAAAMTVAGSSIIATAPALADDAIFETANAAFYYPLELGALLGATVGIYLTLNKVLKLI
eukprot:CAMPEP_0119163364 /NCGR_PEP_ID=MMETSP1315-20130426/3345_1 /TAXON_ID=676789 /ORGANISM="Prasinoderma singularis, Strain RCC927" /LENGTH=109 /DNA_ID=CAMNT_0007156387 /DNA_START=38 /DNA_END=367 /DNA_ORIENTATION=-